MEFKKLPLDENGKLIKNDFEILSPRNLVEVSVVKSGKTLTKANHSKILVGDTEGGTEHFKMSNKVDLRTFEGDDEFIEISKGWVPAGIFQTVDELNRANRMTEYWQLKNRFEEARNYKEKEKIFADLLAHFKGMPFPIFNIDTITAFQNLNNAAALYEYNLSVKPDKQKSDIKKADEYGGVKYIRRQFSVLKDFIENNAAPCIIWSGHIGERKKVLQKAEEDLTVIDIALEGILSTTFTQKADAIAVFYRDETGCYLDFQKRGEDDKGSRPLHLSNKLIKIAEPLQEGERYPKTYWEKVYPELFENNL